jgi:hypothetical protein
MRTVTGALVLLAALVAPSVAGAAIPQCLITCSVAQDCCAVEDCLRAPCGAYLDCVAEAKADFDECIGAIANNPRCRSTGGGRCTITLSCVKKCRALQRADERVCRKNAFRNIDDCNCSKLKIGQQKSVARICRNKKTCSDPIFPTTTTSSTSTTVTTSTEPGATTSTSSSTSSTTVTNTTTTRPTTTTVAASSCEGPGIGGCQRACILRISSLKKNYERCESACNGDQCAENICKKTARDIACEAIKARCTKDGDNPDVAFRNCCGADCPTKEDVGEEVCKILPTTTSSSSTTSTSVATTPSLTTTTNASSTGIFGWGN